MVVNPFWFGFLVCLISEFVLFILIGIIRAAFGKNEENEDVEIREINIPPEIKDALIKEIKKYEEENKHDGV